jgi:hypothetical protein
LLAIQTCSTALESRAINGDYQRNWCGVEQDES